MLNEGNNENILIRRSISISKEGLLEKSSIGESKVKWNQVDKVEETEEYIYIYISSISAHIIPKRVFRDENESRLFIKEIEKFQGLQQ